MNNIKYSDVKDLIQEGDILLFKGKTILSNLISLTGYGVYSHVGVASKVNGHVECVEFREWYGGRAVNLESQLEYGVDIYRPIPRFGHYEIVDATGVPQYKTIDFDGRAVTNTMRKMTGLPYGWKRIWYLAKIKLAVLRLFYDPKDLINDELQDLVYPVCSTAVAYAFSKHGYDLVKNKSDNWTEPNDIARSARLNWLFSVSA